MRQSNCVISKGTWIFSLFSDMIVIMSLLFADNGISRYIKRIKIIVSINILHLYADLFFVSVLSILVLAIISNSQFFFGFCNLME